MTCPESWQATVAVVGVAACFMGALAFDPIATVLLTLFGVWTWKGMNDDD